MAVHAESNIQLNTIPAQTSLLGGHFVYFQGNTGSGGNTPASANVIAEKSYSFGVTPASSALFSIF